MNLALRFSRLALVIGALTLAMGANATEVVASAATIKVRVHAALAEGKADDRLKKLAEIGAKLSLDEIPTALATVGALDELRERAVFRDAVVKKWSELAPAAAFEFLQYQPESRDKLELIRGVVTNYAKQNPARAASAVMAMPAGRSRIEAIGIVAEVWAKSDMSAALAWARELPRGASHDAALYAIRFIWVHSDPEAASVDIQSLPPGDTRNALLMNIAGEWAARDPQGAIAWARGLTDPSEQGTGFPLIAESWADTKPAEAMAFAEKLPPEFAPPAIVAVLTRWATQDPAAAADRAARITDVQLRGKGLVEIFNVWTAVAPDGAAAWVEGIKPMDLHDQAAQAYSEAIVDWSPAAAVRMALTTSDPPLRWQRVGHYLQRWRESDPASTAQWIEAAKVPDEEKTQWRSAHSND